MAFLPRAAAPLYFNMADEYVYCRGKLKAPVILSQMPHYIFAGLAGIGGDAEGDVLHTVLASCEVSPLALDRPLRIFSSSQFSLKLNFGHTQLAEAGDQRFA